jgi:hypothetical protein
LQTCRPEMALNRRTAQDEISKFRQVNLGKRAPSSVPSRASNETAIGGALVRADCRFGLRIGRTDVNSAAQKRRIGRQFSDRPYWRLANGRTPSQYLSLTINGRTRVSGRTKVPSPATLRQENPLSRRSRFFQNSTWTWSNWDFSSHVKVRRCDQPSVDE